MRVGCQDVRGCGYAPRSFLGPICEVETQNASARLAEIDSAYVLNTFGFTNVRLIPRLCL